MRVLNSLQQRALTTLREKYGRGSFTRDDFRTLEFIGNHGKVLGSLLEKNMISSYFDEDCGYHIFYLTDEGARVAQEMRK